MTFGLRDSNWLWGYCEGEYVVSSGCQSYGVRVLGLEIEDAYIDDYVECRDLLGCTEYVDQFVFEY